MCDIVSAPSSPAPVPAKQGITEISLAPAEFDEYSIQLNTCVVFSLKTMRVGRGGGWWGGGGWREEGGVG